MYTEHRAKIILNLENGVTIELPASWSTKHASRDDVAEAAEYLGQKLGATFSYTEDEDDEATEGASALKSVLEAADKAGWAFEFTPDGAARMVRKEAHADDDAVKPDTMPRPKM